LFFTLCTNLAPDHVHRWLRTDLPHHRSFNSVPRLIPSYSTSDITTTHNNKERLLQLAAFEASYHDAKTPITPDAFPIIIDTGASISITPYATDFITKITPVQDLEIKGIASGLKVLGSGSVKYTFYNDDGALETLNLKYCLYVPQCTARLLCPRQLGASFGHTNDGFNSTLNHGTLTSHGRPTTIQYDTVTKLPILYTASGMTSFYRYCAKQSCLTQLKSEAPTPMFLPSNMTPKQRQKLYWHEHCAHVATFVQRWAYIC
jgi:hypothetical protein